jgi:hypothetical protein
VNRRQYCYIALILTILLGIHEGKLALWRQGEQYPLRVFPLNITSLPRADQSMLAEGIPVESEQQLAHLLEDYLS